MRFFNMRIAIVGAGPAGARLAHQLSENGNEVLLLDAREAWEKPCGGGVTSKALREFEFLRNGDAPKQMISSLRLITARNRELTVAPRHDFAIYSRKELSRMMRQEAVDAGARLHCLRVENTSFANGKWRIETDEGGCTSFILVGDLGGRRFSRRQVRLDM